MDGRSRESVRLIRAGLAAVILACGVWAAGAQGAGWSPEEFIYSPKDIAAMRARFKQEPEDGRLHGLLKAADRWMRDVTPEFLETMLPEETPLGETWFHTGCPACGKSHAINWTGHRARGHLACQFCKTVFPNDKFPESSTYTANGKTYHYHQGKNGRGYHFSAFTRYKRVRWTLKSDRPHQYLAIGWLLTGDPKYARKAADVLVRYARVYPGWFLHYYGPVVSLPSAQADPKVWVPKVATVQDMRARRDRWSRTRWVYDSVFLTEVAFAYGAIRASGVMSDAKHQLLRDLARNTIEWNLLPLLYYKSSSFSNVHGYMYDTMIMTGRAFGTELVCKDVIFGAFTLNGVDLIHEAYDGSRGVVYACENLVDREGCYVESSPAYYQMIVGSMMGTLLRAKGYVDPPGYSPSPKVAAYYKGRRRLEPARDIDFKRLFGYYRTVMSGGEFPAINDSNVGMKPGAKIFFTAYMATGDEEVKAALKALTPKGNPHYSGYGMHYIPTLKSESYDAIWSDETKAAFPLFSGVKSYAGLGVLRGKGPTDLYLNWDAQNASHVQQEQLALVFFADTHEALLDFGYRGSGSGLRSLWLNRTIAHNTVTVDEDLQISRQRGELGRYCDLGDIRIVQASDPAAFPGLKQFRRTVALVDTDRKNAYGLDVFEVVGGRTHDQSWVGNGKLLDIRGATLTPRKGTMLGEGTKYGDVRPVGKSRAGKLGNGYGYINELAMGTCTEKGWVADWQLDKSPLKLRVLGASSSGDMLIRGQCPHERDRKGERGKKGPIVIARRKAGKGGALASVFGSVFEAYGEQPNAMSATRLTSGRGVEAALQSGRERRDSLEVAENGAVTYLSREGDTLRDLVLVGKESWAGLGWQVSIPGARRKEIKIDLKKGLLAHWTFDEGKGKVVTDKTGQGNNGALKIWGNKATLPAWVPGKHGSALKFDGVGSYVDLGNNANLNMGMSDFSIAMWIRRDGTGNQQALLSKRSAAGGGKAGWIVRTQGVRGDDIFLQLGDGRNDFIVFTKSEIKDNRWHHVAFVVDRDSKANIRAYVDGRNVTRPIQGNLKQVGNINTDTPACIAERGGKGRTWNGALDDIRIYTRALAEPEIKQLYGVAGESSAPVAKLGSGKVLEMNGKDLSLLVDAALPGGTTLAGQLIRLTSRRGVSGHFVVERVAREGRGSRVFIDPTTGSFASNTGLVDEVVTAREFITGTPFRHGNWGEMHQGDVVLIGDRTFRIAKVDYLGWKKRNRVRVTLDSNAFKGQSGLGGKFIVSAAAPGNRWDMELIVRIRRLKDNTYSVTCPIKASIKVPPGVKLNSR